MSLGGDLQTLWIQGWGLGIKLPTIIPAEIVCSFILQGWFGASAVVLVVLITKEETAKTAAFLKEKFGFHSVPLVLLFL